MLPVCRTLVFSDVRALCAVTSGKRRLRRRRDEGPCPGLWPLLWPSSPSTPWAAVMARRLVMTKHLFSGEPRNDTLRNLIIPWTLPRSLTKGLFPSHGGGTRHREIMYVLRTSE